MHGLQEVDTLVRNPSRASSVTSATGTPLAPERTMQTLITGCCAVLITALRAGLGSLAAAALTIETWTCDLH